MTISGSVSAYINGGIAIVAVIATFTPSMFPSYIPSGVVADTIQTCGFITALYGAVNVFLHKAGGNGVSA
jgi:hypothetical protein